MKILCLHAHESNGIYIEKLFQEQSVILEHLVYSLPSKAEKVTGSALEKSIAEKITKDVTGIMITCTVYSSLIESNEIENRPVFRIEDPMIAAIASDDREKVLFFSNPETVPLTMKKVEKLYESKGKGIDYQVVIIPDVFPLILANQKSEYRRALLDFIRQYGSNNRRIYLMQLSMSVVEGQDFLGTEQEVITVYGKAAAELHHFL